MKSFHRFLHLWIFLLLCSHTLWASHIFGGNMYLTQVDKATGKFKLTMNIYVDDITLVPVELANLQSQSRLLKIFSKSGNVKMMDVALPFEKLFNLVYDNESCSKLKNLKTKEFRYSQEITLNPNIFSDNAGYYIAWTRCCRNADIDNIVKPDDTGLTLYLEFPALKQNGENIAYSSPVFPIPNGDYICANKAFKLDLGANNSEPTDELVYSIVTPYGSLNDLNNYDRIVQAGPYPRVSWLPGYSQSVSIKGSKPLSVDAKTGVISVTANTIGLYAFTIQCDQYRKGVKIGSVRHDYQLPVVDCSGTTPSAGRITSNGSPITEASICPGEAINLEVSNTGGSFNFQWQKDGDNIAGANSPTYQATQLGDYTVVKSFKAVCANDTVSQVVKVKQVVLVKAKSPTAILCEGDSVQIEAIPQRNTVALAWNLAGSTLSNKAKFYAKAAGKYYILGSITNPNCESKDSVEITKKASPTLTLDSRNITLPLGESRTLNVLSDNASTTFKWSPPKWIDNVSINNPKITPEDNIVYRVLASTPNLCPVRDSVMVFVTKSILIPTMFSPNGDSMNDTWEISGIQNFRDCEVSIFNRWGELIFYSKGYTNPWDGKYKEQLVAAGQYVYEIRGASQRDGFVYMGVLGVGY
jgi:gliding motility-associated-like protein